MGWVVVTVLQSDIAPKHEIENELEENLEPSPSLEISNQIYLVSFESTLI